MRDLERPRSGGVYVRNPDGSLKQIEGPSMPEESPSHEESTFFVDINKPADVQDDEEEEEG